MTAGLDVSAGRHVKANFDLIGLGDFIDGGVLLDVPGVAALQALLNGVTRDAQDFFSFPGGSGWGGDIEANNVFVDDNLVAGRLPSGPTVGIFFGDPGGAPGKFTTVHLCTVASHPSCA